MTLQRRKPLRAQPRAKGNRAERAIVDMLKHNGWEHARRNWQSGGQGGGDIIGGPADVHVEVKHCEAAKIWEWLAQAEGEARPTDIPVVVCRCNKTPWFAVLPRDEWEALRALTTRPVFAVVRELERASLWAWIIYAIEGAARGEIPVVLFRRARSEWFAAVPAGELLGLLREREMAA